MEEYFCIISPLLAFQRIVIANRLIVALIGANTCMHARLFSIIFSLSHCYFVFLFSFFPFCFCFEIDGILNLVFAVSEVPLFLFFLFFLKNKSYEAIKLKERTFGLRFSQVFWQFCRERFFFSQEKHLFSIAM